MAAGCVREHQLVVLCSRYSLRFVGSSLTPSLRYLAMLVLLEGKTCIRGDPVALSLPVWQPSLLNGKSSLSLIDFTVHRLVGSLTLHILLLFAFCELCIALQDLLASGTEAAILSRAWCNWHRFRY